MVFVFFRLTSLCMIISRSSHVAADEYAPTLVEGELIIVKGKGIKAREKFRKLYIKFKT